ncbi:RQC domain-containing protein [Klenkia terrae]|uniref:RecQ family ATP-dependent DNA helicase n=1 Tax=Klenkia terrae TaxID=1052259 RepID=UPI0036143B47
MVQQRKMIDGSDGDAAHRRVLTGQLDAMLALCETVDCRRVRLLAHFGQESEACGNCDTCLTPPETWDGTIPAQMLLSTVLRLQRERGQSFGAGQSIDILLGKRTEKVTQHGHDQLSTFGIGTDLSEQQWRGVVRQLLAQGLLAVQGEYGTLALNEASGPVLRREQSVPMRREAERSARSRSSRSTKAAVDLAPEAAPAFERLRAWRAATAKEQGVPAYVVFHDATLRQIATESPADVAALGTISGVGAAKLERYGEGILEALRG